MSVLETAKAQLRIHLEQFASRMAREVIGPVMPDGVAFAFVAFDDEGNVAYCGNGERAGVAKAMRFLIDKWRRGQLDETDVDKAGAEAVAHAETLKGWLTNDLQCPDEDTIEAMWAIVNATLGEEP